MRPLVLSLICGCFLAGCGAPHLHTVRQAKTDLVGEPVATIEQCIGQPQFINTGAGTEVWRYSSAQILDTGDRTLADPKPDPAADARACVFDFYVVDGRVTRVRSDNRAGWGFGSITRCSRLVSRCVALP